MKFFITILLTITTQSASAFDAFGRFLDTSPFVFQFGQSGAGDAVLRAANSVHFDGEKIYVSEFNYGLKVFNKYGEFLQKKEGIGAVLSISSSTNRVFVNTNGGLQIFDKNLNFITSYPSSSYTYVAVAFNDSNSQVAISENGYSKLLILTEGGSLLRQCLTSISAGTSTYDALATSDNKIFVPDHTNLKIKVFDYDCNFIAEFGGAGTALGQFQNLRALHFDKSRKLLYVGDRYSIQAFSESGVALKRWNYGSTGKGSISYLNSISAHDSTLIVSDSSRNSVNILAPF